MISDIDYDEPLLFRCVGGPWDGRSIPLGDDEATMVFRLGQRRGRYSTREVGKTVWLRQQIVPTCQWQDVPIGAEYSALRTH